MHAENESDIESKHAKRILFYLVVGFSLTFITIQSYVRCSNKKEVLSDFDVTHGWITKYFDGDGSDAGNGRTITYAYKVGQHVYSRYVVTTHKFPECEKEVNTACAQKQFGSSIQKKSG